ncbi:imelysin family protein [Teredinibacter purpureus]|uniref:imelysin family protein n=1 Tax=Teredinibacter purpureus TaxID=2731756 RepID=UPI0005F7E98F|nr:imelysin family protein [Teredinibacter purpureus]
MSFYKIALAASLSFGLLACGGDDGKDGVAGTNGVNGVDGNDGANGIPSLVTTADVVRTNANIAYASYSDSFITAVALQQKLEALVDAPSAETLMDAKTAWLAAREPYGQTEVYRFREGPIDALNGDGSMGSDGDGPEGRINAWPLGEALIDYVANQVDGDSRPESSSSSADISFNIIADVDSFPSITADTLTANFELGGDERNVTTGYHAIEFLLWGQDLNEDLAGTGERDTSAGQRPYTDYVTGISCTSGADSADASICERRGDYLLAAGDLLIDDLQALVEAWNPSIADNHYADFVAGGNASLAAILESMGRLGFGELAGERMNIALLQDSQEDEHSCFSDNTHRDIYLNAKGIDNSFHGEYTQVDGDVVSGAGIGTLLLASGEIELENQLRAALEDTMIKVDVIDQTAQAGLPFDNQIQTASARAAISAAIAGLAAQTAVIEDVIQVLNLTTEDLRQDTEEDI